MAKRTSGLTMDDSGTIGFVGWCLSSNAIDTPELRLWAEHVMVSAVETDDYPLYIVDLAGFDEPMFHFDRVVGFTPDRTFSKLEQHAISGIAVIRGRELSDGPNVQTALNSLESCPHILAEFQRTFPFIEIPKG